MPPYACRPVGVRGPGSPAVLGLDPSEVPPYQCPADIDVRRSLDLWSAVGNCAENFRGMREESMRHVRSSIRRPAFAAATTALVLFAAGVIGSHVASAA